MNRPQLSHIFVQHIFTDIFSSKPSDIWIFCQPFPAEFQ